MNIHLMAHTDFEEVLHLWKNTPGMGLNVVDDSKSGITKYLNRNPNTCFVARENNELIGVILSGHDGRRAFIHHLAVRLDKQNKGTGKKLIETAIQALKNEGISKVALVVFKNNHKGNLFWDKLGFINREDLNYRNKSISDIELTRIDT